MRSRMIGGIRICGCCETLLFKFAALSLIKFKRAFSGDAVSSSPEAVLLMPLFAIEA